MKIALPIVTKDEIVGDKRVTEYGEKTFVVDSSLECLRRWESKFPEMTKTYPDLVSYTEYIKDKDNSAATILSKMKVLFCYFDTDMTFTQFLQLFDFSNPVYLERLTERLKTAFEIIFAGASEKN